MLEIVLIVMGYVEMQTTKN